MKKKRAPKSESPTESNICFTIMPFGAWFDSYYDEVYVPAIEAAGLIARRADDLYRPSAIVHDIWSLTTTAKLLLADLTGKNPNVFYELGLAHAIAKPVILVTESIEDIPFDLRALRVITYDKNLPNWGEVLGDKIEKAIKEVLSAPLESVLPTFLKVREEGRATITHSEKELLSLRQDVELMRQEFHSRLEQVRDFGRPVGSAGADFRIRRYVSAGTPEPAIIDRMKSTGLPIEFIMDRIRVHQRRLQDAVASKAPAEAPKLEGKDDAAPKERGV